MTKAVLTKFIGPSNTKGSRIKASDNDGNSVTLSYDHAKNSEHNHASAAADLLAKLKWSGVYVGGHLLNAGRQGRMVWVCTSDGRNPSLTALTTSKGFEVNIDLG